MAFVKSLNMTIATLSAKSDKILSSFSKTKEDLISLNKSSETLYNGRYQNEGL